MEDKASIFYADDGLIDSTNPVCLQWLVLKLTWKSRWWWCVSLGLFLGKNTPQPMGGG